jgi:DNA-binding NtrC family response regulator
LEACGWQVLVAPTSERAKSILRQQAIDLVIADIRMPTESGISLLYSIRDAQPELPLVVITGYPDLSAVDAALKLRVSDFITKPFSPQELTSRVQCILLKPEGVAETSSPQTTGADGLAPELIEVLHQSRARVFKGVIKGPVVPDSLLVELVKSRDVATPAHLESCGAGTKVYIVVADT